MNKYGYKDRNGVPLKPGQKVRIQHCVGRYGQVRIVEGEIGEVGLGGVTLKGKNEYGKPTLTWVTVAPNGYHKHEDFEHGHEVWTEVVG